MNPPPVSRNRSTGSVWLLAFAASFLLGLIPATAEITVELALDPTKINPGQQAELAIIINDVPRTATVIRPTLTGIDESLRHIFVTSSRSFMEINGRFIQRTTALYRITGEQPGIYTIPAQTVEIDGLKYKTGAVEFTVNDTGESTAEKPNYDPFVTLEFAKTEIFVGEVIPVTLRLKVHKQTRLVSPGRVEMPREDFVVRRFPARPVSSVSADEDGYISYSYTTALSAIRPGTFSIGPATLECIVEFPVERNLGRGFPAFQLSEPRRFKLQSDPGEITVKPLPENPPPGFNDAVGRFVMNVEAAPLNLNVGDPISLEVEITGTGNLDTLTMPKISDPEGWKLYEPRMRKQEGASGLEPTTVSFSQVLVPNVVRESLSPLRFVYFDPESKDYVSLESAPIPLQIAPLPQPVASNPAPAGSDGGTRPDLAPPVPLLGDIVVPLSRPSLSSLPIATSPTPLHLQRSFWLFQVIPLTFVLLLIGIHFRRWFQNREPREKKPSPKLVIKELEQSGITARRFYRLAGSLVDSWVVRRGSSANLNADLSQIVERQHALCYTAPGDGGEIPVPPPERERVIAALKKLKF